MSEWYRKSLSEKQKVAQAKLKEQGKYQGGKITYGKDLGENGVLVDCEKQKREINLIMSLRNKGTKYKDKQFIHIYSIPEATKEIKEAGFEIVEIET